MAFGPELFVGCSRDPWYGAHLVLARGGVNVEETANSRILPITAMAAEIGAAAASLVGRVAAAFGDGSLSGYATVELNPVILDAGGPKIADVLLVGVA
jgi:hypothetical protein